MPDPVTTVASLEGVNKNYGSIRALRGVNFRVRAGEVVALLGPNGAGKTTAVKLLLGLIAAQRGKSARFRWRPHESRKPDENGRDVASGTGSRNAARPRTHRSVFQLLPETDGPGGRAGCGQVWRNWAIASSAIFREDNGSECCSRSRSAAIRILLFLDEPTVGLDVEARRMLWDEIRRMVSRGKTVLLTTHYLQEADALADRVAVINQGEIIAQGTPSEIKAKTAGKRIRCITSLSVNALRQIPGVTEVKEDREAVEIHARRRPSRSFANCWRGTRISRALKSPARDWKRRSWR